MHKQPQQNNEFHEESSTLSLSEAAIFLNVSKNTLISYESQKLLVPARNHHGHRTYTKEQLQTFKNNRLHTTASAAAILGISASKLRKIEATGQITVPRDSKNRRQYSTQLLKDIKQVLTTPTSPPPAAPVTSVSTPVVSSSLSEGARVPPPTVPSHQAQISPSLSIPSPRDCHNISHPSRSLYLTI